MRKLIFFMHTSLDGMVAGAQGELSWVKMNEELMDFVAEMTANADTALYGRVTYELMESYWPTAGDEANASQHTKNHAVWYSQVPKVVLSQSLQGATLRNTLVINKDLKERINALKAEEGKNILIFGSPGASVSLINEALIDEFWFFVNPIILGKGKHLYTEIKQTVKMELLESKTFNCGVIALHYRLIKEN